MDEGDAVVGELDGIAEDLRRGRVIRNQELREVSEEGVEDVRGVPHGLDEPDIVAWNPAALHEAGVELARVQTLHIGDGDGAAPPRPQTPHAVEGRRIPEGEAGPVEGGGAREEPAADQLAVGERYGIAHPQPVPTMYLVPRNIGMWYITMLQARAIMANIVAP